MKTIQRGFTIVELIIVIVVIGVLTAILVVGYGAVQNNAHDAAVKADLQKIDDAMKQFALDHEGVFPASGTDMLTLGLKLNQDAYNTSNKANIYLCTNATATEYAVISMAKSGKRFLVKSESGISEYTGSVVWNATTANWTPTCQDINSGYDNPTRVTGFTVAGWVPWTGVTNDTVITNYVSNPSGEGTSLLINSAGGPTISLSSTTFSGWPSSGTKSHKIVTTTASDTRVRPPNNTIPVDTSKSISVSAKIYNAAVTSRTFRVSFQGRSSGGVSYQTTNGVADYVIAANTAVTVTGVLSPAVYATDFSNAAYVEPMFTRLASGGAIGDTFYIDSIILSYGSSPYTFADGNTTNWSWTGTVNNSPSKGPAL